MRGAQPQFQLGIAAVRGRLDRHQHPDAGAVQHADSGQIQQNLAVSRLQQLLDFSPNELALSSRHQATRQFQHQHVFRVPPVKTQAARIAPRINHRFGPFQAVVKKGSIPAWKHSQLAQMR